MKNKIGLIAVIVIFVIICGVGYIIHHNANSNYQKIDITTLTEKIADKDSFILYIAQDELSSSASFSSILKLVAEKHNVKVYYIDISNLSTEDFAAIFNAVSINKAPTLAYIEGGVETDITNRVVDYVDDETTRDAIVKSLTTNRYIKS